MLRALALMALCLLRAGAQEAGGETCSSESCAAADPPPAPPCTVFIATPMYGGAAQGAYVLSLVALLGQLRDAGCAARYEIVQHESLVTRARNVLLTACLASDATHCLLLDADVGFEAGDVMRMLRAGLDFAGAAYPKKGVNWANVAAAARQHPEMPAEELERLLGYYVINFLPGTERIGLDQPVEVRELGAGLLLLRRGALEAMVAAHPERRHVAAGGGETLALFDTGTEEGSGRYLSEDFFFCALWRALGGRVWLCPWVRTTHTGSYSFQGDLRSIADRVGNLFAGGAPAGGGEGDVRKLRW